MKFYIYKHIRPDTGEVFYIGKGNTSKNSHEARYKTASGRNKIWKSIVAKNNGVFIPEIICYCDTEEEVNELEKHYISLYGRRNLNKGTLCNLTDGADGSFGIKVSDETRKKLSIAFSGEKHPNFGKKLSKETCLKKSETLKNSDKNLRGKKLPDWWKDKIRETKIGELNPMFGRTGELSCRSRKVIDINNGSEYFSVTIAAEANGINMKTLYNMLSGHRPNKTTLKFV
jgi:hypothetical protein